MTPYPHTYVVAAKAAPEGIVALDSPGLSRLDSAPPEQFGGPGDQWSPETLLCAAVADCFVLTFRAVSRASKFPWIGIECRTDAILDRVEGVSRFTVCTTSVVLTVPAGSDEAKAHLLLEKSEKGCLVANSLTAERRLEVRIVTAG